MTQVTHLLAAIEQGDPHAAEQSAHWLKWEEYYTRKDEELKLTSDATPLPRELPSPVPDYVLTDLEGAHIYGFVKLFLGTKRKIILNHQHTSLIEKIAPSLATRRKQGLSAKSLAPGGFYYGKGENDKFEISMVRTLLDEPEDMVAVLAHETAHIKLLGEDRIAENNEPLTDLTTIFFELGVFNANSAFKTFADNKYWGWSQSGYLSQMAWGYALALFAYVRQEEAPAWASHLCKNVKGDFIQGQNFIANNEELIFQH